MSQKVNKLSGSHLKVLGLFTRGFDKEYYIREVQRLLNISTRTAQIVLNDLEKRGVLKSKTRGKIRTYRLMQSILTKEYLLLAESYKTIKLLEKAYAVKEIADKLLPIIKGIAVVFGSYAKGTQKKDSDLDILVVGSHDFKKAKEISRLYGIQVSIKNYSLNVFKQKLRRDILLKEVIDNHVILSGKEEFIDNMFRWKR